MSMFTDLMGKIFGQDDDTPKSRQQKFKVKNTDSLDPEKQAAKKAAAKKAPSKKAAAKKAAKKKTAAQANPVDVARMLDRRAKARAKEGIDWRRSIVDLMKICGMNSSFSARKELAKELGYPGEISGRKSAKMNIWLHKEMMRQIVANGGKVPKKLL